MAAELPAGFCAKSGWQPSYPQVFAQHEVLGSASRTDLLCLFGCGSASAADPSTFARCGGLLSVPAAKRKREGLFGNAAQKDHVLAV
jgi:hypothetical protein